MLNLKSLVLLTLIAPAVGCASIQQLGAEFSQSGGLSTADITAGLKAALSKGASSAVASLGSAGGYSSSSTLRIAFPAEAEPVANALRKVGLGSLVTSVEDRLNAGAEAGARRALPIFQQAIQDMTIADAAKILKGSEHAATDYFKEYTYTSLEAEFQPEMVSALSQTGATTAWTELTTRYNQIPFTSHKVDTNLASYATERALDGLFNRIAAEEESIRADPVARTTDLLKRVFGSAE